MATTGTKRAPVKVGCLACRASHVRCSGEKPTCSVCLAKERQCVYTKSNRGGPRISRKKLEQQSQILSPPAKLRRPSAVSQISNSSSCSSYKSHEFESFDDLVSSMIDPGAGLKTFQSNDIFSENFRTHSNSDDVDQLFDRIFGIEKEVQKDFSGPFLRTYSSDGAILNAYYIYIHPYFPILPPSNSSVIADCPLSNGLEDFESSSPISLALSAVLSLIPHPNDPSPQSQKSVQYRRKHAELFSQLAMESIEIESELLSSETSPADALAGNTSSFRREPFHSRVPIELESTQAFLVLSAYEYAQRGNMTKQRSRANQALDAAFRLRLHEEDYNAPKDIYTEAKRRAWWMTYVCVLQSAIVSSTPPIIAIEHINYSTPFPSNESDQCAWGAFLDAQQLILKCTQYTVSLKAALRAGIELLPLRDLMASLSAEIDLVESKYSWNIEDTSTMPSGPEERVVGYSLKAQARIKLNSSRIKLHRYDAFQDKPIFTKRHCDLEKAPDSSNSCCGSFQPASQLPSPPAMDIFGTQQTSTNYFTSPMSAKICLRAALAITRAFESLPYPDPRLTANATHVPRTMPIFACCAMQSSYALLMLCDKYKELSGNSSSSLVASSGLNELYSGLEQVLHALRNYSIAFEAIDGMRAQIQEAFDFSRYASNG